VGYRIYGDYTKKLFLSGNEKEMTNPILHTPEHNFLWIPFKTTIYKKKRHFTYWHGSGSGIILEAESG
jgi:hypothetical protein